MTDGRIPQWVKCGECGHKWIGYYMPIEVNRLNKIVRAMRCPSCAVDAKKIYITQGGKEE